MAYVIEVTPCKYWKGWVDDDEFIVGYGSEDAVYFETLEGAQLACKKIPKKAGRGVPVLR